MRLVVVCIALLSVACEASISLGSECPTQSGRCSQPDDDDNDDDTPPKNPDADDQDDAEVAMDASVSDAGKSDAGRVPDASRPRDASSRPDAPDAAAPEDAGPALFPALRNPSFELVDGGTEGELPLNIPRGSTAIEPWYPCRSGMQVVSSVTLNNGTVVRPRQGATFFADSFPGTIINVNGLTQDLLEPLRAGQRYAFDVDLWSEPGPLATKPLELQVVSAAGCLTISVDPVFVTDQLLARSPPVEPGAWRTVCLSFTPRHDTNGIMFWVDAQLDVNAGSRFFVDDIRPATTCK